MSLGRTGPLKNIFGCPLVFFIFLSLYLQSLYPSIYFIFLRPMWPGVALRYLGRPRVEAQTSRELSWGGGLVLMKWRSIESGRPVVEVRLTLPSQHAWLLVSEWQAEWAQPALEYFCCMDVIGLCLVLVNAHTHTQTKQNLHKPTQSRSEKLQT